MPARSTCGRPSRARPGDFDPGVGCWSVVVKFVNFVDDIAFC